MPEKSPARRTSIDDRVVALEALEEQLRRRVSDLDVLVEGFHARIDAILTRMDAAADKVTSLAEALEQVGGAIRSRK
jgi:predicted  nucleic acid-binding Zn-ribbon protein